MGWSAYAHDFALGICRAVDKYFSLGVLTFTAHYKQLCAVDMCIGVGSKLEVQRPCYAARSTAKNGK